VQGRSGVKGKGVRVREGVVEVGLACDAVTHHEHVVNQTQNAECHSNAKVLTLRQRKREEEREHTQRCVMSYRRTTTSRMPVWSPFIPGIVSSVSLTFFAILLFVFLSTYRLNTT
jgi:hypothetical protein